MLVLQWLKGQMQHVYRRVRFYSFDGVVLLMLLPACTRRCAVIFAIIYIGRRNVHRESCRRFAGVAFKVSFCIRRSLTCAIKLLSCFYYFYITSHLIGHHEKNCRYVMGPE